MARSIRPRFLGPGSKVALVSPSDPAAGLFPERVRAAQRTLAGRGIELRVMPRAAQIHPHHLYLAGRDEDRAKDLMEAYLDPEVDAIWAAIGGLNSNRVLDCLDFEAISRCPKPLIGYSDVTVLLNAVTAASGLVTFHGPNLLVEWGSDGGPDPYTERAFWQVLSEEGTRAPIALAGAATTRLEPWPPGEPSHLGRRPWVSNGQGIGEGRIVGGNLRSLLRLAGTPWWPDFDGAVLLWEEVGLTDHALDAMLVQLRTLGALDRVAAVVIGKVVDSSETELMDPGFLMDLVTEIARRPLPIVAHVDLGHTDPMLTFPLGVRLRVDSDQACLILLEPAVDGKAGNNGR